MGARYHCTEWVEDSQGHISGSSTPPRTWKFPALTWEIHRTLEEFCLYNHSRSTRTCSFNSKRHDVVGVLERQAQGVSLDGGTGISTFLRTGHTYPLSDIAATEGGFHHQGAARALADPGATVRVILQAVWQPTVI